MIAEIVPKILPNIIQRQEVGFDSTHHTLERQRNAPEMLKRFKEAQFLRRISSRYVYGMAWLCHEIIAWAQEHFHKSLLLHSEK